MHPCREFWSQDIAYGSLFTGAPRRRDDFTAAPPEIYIFDVDTDAPAARPAGFADLMQRLAGLDVGEETLRQSAVQLQQFLRSEAPARHEPRSVQERRFGVRDGAGERILGVAAVRREERPPLRPRGRAACVPEPAAPAAPLGDGFMRRLAELARRDEGARIDWLVVRVGDAADASAPGRPHLGAARVSRIGLQPFAPPPAVPVDDANY